MHTMQQEIGTVVSPAAFLLRGEHSNAGSWHLLMSVHLQREQNFNNLLEGRRLRMSGRMLPIRFSWACIVSMYPMPWLSPQRLPASFAILHPQVVLANPTGDSEARAL